jgi:DNA-binding NtrC family response regulator
MTQLRRIVLVSNKAPLRDIAQEVAHDVFVADDMVEACDIVNTVTPDMIIFDETFRPGHIREFLDTTDNDPSRSPIVAVAGSPNAPFCEQDYHRANVPAYLLGTACPNKLKDLVAQATAARDGRAPVTTNGQCFVDATAANVGMVGRSAAVRKTIDMIRLVAHSRCNPVLVVGETGTGKEIAARAIHTLRHPEKPFVAVNCAALTANLLESELLGHVKGAFTGADRDKTGLLELAGAGTIFLDEISEIPAELQAKLLRVLQEKTFRRVGGVKDITCEATIIASSNRQLKKEVEAKRFRQDLFYRLNICPITLAPLRSPDRREDIQVLAEYFLRTSAICGPTQTKARAITKLAMEALHKHHWPGNVRELRNVIERAILLETTEKIGLSSIMIDRTEPETTNGGLFSGRIRDFSLEKAERELIARALHETGWQKTQAAAMLGITRATLYAKVKQYNIQQQRARSTSPAGASPDCDVPETVAVG